LGFDRGRELSERVAAAGRALSAVAAAGVGGDVVADEGQYGGERDGGDAGPGCGRGPGGHGRDHVVHEQQRPGFLPGQGGRPAAKKRSQRSMEKKPRSARLSWPGPSAPSSWSARAFSPSW